MPSPDGETVLGRVLSTCFTVLVLSTLYSDRVMGGISGRLVGIPIPSTDNWVSRVMYWTCFVAKRLASLSF